MGKGQAPKVAAAAAAALVLLAGGGGAGYAVAPMKSEAATFPLERLVVVEQKLAARELSDAELRSTLKELRDTIQDTMGPLKDAVLLWTERSRNLDNRVTALEQRERNP